MAIRIIENLCLKHFTIVFKLQLMFCLCALALNLNAQDETIDSLKLEIKTAKHDTTRCIALVELGEYIFNQTPDSALVLWQKVVETSNENLKKTTDKNSRSTFTFLLARAYQNYGYYHQTYSGPDEGLKYFKKSLVLNEERGDKENMANCLVDIGQIYFRKGNVLQALEYYHKALKVFEKINSFDNMAFCLGNMGNLYAAQNDLENALNYLNRSAKLYEKNKSNSGLAFALTGISSIYSDKGDPQCKQTPAICNTKSKEKALKGYLKVLELWTSENNQSGIASVSLYIASLYRNQGDLTKALEYATRALNLNESLKAKPGISASANILANIMFDKGDIKSAEQFADKSMKVATELGYPKILMSVSSTLKKIYEKQNNYKGALEMEELSVKMRDSLNNETTRKTSIKKQFELEYEMQAEKDSILNASKIEKEALRHEQAIAQQRIYTFGGILGFMFMLIVAIVSFRAYKIKQSANTIITQQSAKIEMANKDLQRQHLLNQKIFSVISHDFRGPILSLNLLLNKFKDSSNNEKLNKYLKDINVSVHNANTVLNNLLNWAKTEIAVESFDKSDCNVDEVVFKTEQEFEEKLSEKNLEIVKHIPKDATIMLPHDILQIAIRNLISNAIKFSNADSKIEISYDQDKTSFIVKDFGVGISPEKQALLFNNQVNAGIGTNKEEGFGIGLYIVSELLYKYGFKINLESKLNEGTTFNIIPK
jgi:two-component system sensor histidine kinase/response regulator